MGKQEKMGKQKQAFKRKKICNAIVVNFNFCFVSTKVN